LSALISMVATTPIIVLSQIASAALLDGAGRLGKPSQS